jgi:Gametolysin peptidase M11
MHPSKAYFLTAVIVAFLSSACCSHVDYGYVDVMSAINQDSSVEQYLFLKDSQDAPWKSVYNVKEHNIMSGDFIGIDKDNSTNIRVIKPVDDQAIVYEIYNGSVIDVKSVIYIVSLCGWNVSASVEQVKQLYFTHTSNINSYFRNCSYDKVTMKPQNNIVFKELVIPCNGTVATGFIKYNFNSRNSCGAGELFAWKTFPEIEAAKDPVIAQFMKTSFNRRIITILPKEVSCMWAGLGAVGCNTNTCPMYIKGTSALDKFVHVHELGHTHGLSHAGRFADEYGDPSDVMGKHPGPNIAGFLCMNAGNQFRVQWNKPIAVLTPTNINTTPSNTGQRFVWNISSSALTDEHYILVNFSLPSFPFPNLFLSFRANTTFYDSAMDRVLNNKLLIHNFNGSASPRNYNRTWLSAVLTNGESYTSPIVRSTSRQIGVKINVLSVKLGSHAIVRVCMVSNLTDSCPIKISELGLNNSTIYS